MIVSFQGESQLSASDTIHGPSHGQCHSAFFSLLKNAEIYFYYVLNCEPVSLIEELIKETQQSCLLFNKFTPN